MGGDSSEKGTGKQSRVERSIRRRPLLGAIGGLGIAGGLPGCVGAQDEGTDGWPEPDDAYYAGLVDELAGMGLPPAEFVHGETESSTREQYWAGTEEFGTAESLDVSGDDVPFSEATRFDVTEEPNENWDVQLRTADWASDPYRSIEEGQVMLGVAYLRAPAGDGIAQYVADIHDVEDPWNFVVGDVDYQEPPAEWQRYFFPVEFGAAADGDAFEWSTQFHLGFGVQTVDVGGVALLDFGQSIEASELPSGAVGDDYDGGDDEDEDEPGEEYDSWPDVDDEYYAGLVDELSQLDIAPGRFVYAENEPDTFAAYDLGGANVDLAEQEELDVSEDDVPFSEATRIEVGELADDESLDPWGVNFQAGVEERAVSSGDTLLGVAYLRTPQLGGSSADVTYKSTDADNESANYVLNGGVSVGQEWERYFFPIGFQSAGDAGEWWTEFWVGVEGQTVDIGGVALLDFAGGAEPHELPSWDSEMDLGEWEAAADQRIQDHRTAELTVEVTDDGDTVEGAAVDVSMVEHEFTFGTAVDANRLQEEGEDGDRYRETITELFNAAVLENQHKWRFWEENQELADDATDWLLERDLDVRGHAALWAAVDSWAVPPDVVSAMGVEWEDNDVTDPEFDPEHVEQRSFDHLEAIIDHYGDDMVHWDVVNEVVHETAMIEAIDGEDVDPVEAPVLAEWYRRATEVAPEGVELDVNDYNTLVGPYEGTRDAYERQIEFLAEAEGVDLGGIGMQSHFSRSSQLTPAELLEAFDRYAAAGDGASLRITEFDMADPNWLETDKADFFHWFLKTLFSHPDVDDFLMWGFWDGDHWEDDAPLFYEDWEEKPSYDVYTDLVFGEWWTEETGSTDEDGRVTVTGFRGEYEVTVTADGVERTETVALSEGGRTAEIDLAEDDDDSSGSDDDSSSGNDDSSSGSDDDSGKKGDGSEDDDGDDEQNGDDDEGEDDSDDDSGDQDQDQDQSQNGDEDQDRDDTEQEDDEQADDEGESGDGDDDSIPGFGVVAGLAGLGAAARHLLSKTDEERRSGDTIE
ncbi:endo-1,4-beta-xylanase [Natronoglomus mannanivorans]|uniref:endo-1,4-beta-xylanase n=1 Tax=Natronoglomus mannanivorans TaxID=2979990 RepID=A0AAP2Z4E8_9EURY|nr:endo-1,4-beta-xylanase [Halobacteria archaeon AArc-xg1-1]